jgi:hypothetical protein
MIQALAPDYLWFWIAVGVFFAVCVIYALVVLTLILRELRR